MARRNKVGILAMGAAAALIMTGCATKAEPYSPSIVVGNVPVGQAQLSDGRYLDCVSSKVTSDRLTLDCDWSNPRREPDPSKQLFGSYNVFKKALNDGRVLDCIAFNVQMGGTSEDDCDWSAPQPK